MWNCSLEYGSNTCRKATQTCHCCTSRGLKPDARPVPTTRSAFPQRACTASSMFSGIVLRLLPGPQKLLIPFHCRPKILFPGHIADVSARSMGCRLKPSTAMHKPGAILILQLMRGHLLRCRAAVPYQGRVMQHFFASQKLLQRDSSCRWMLLRCLQLTHE